MNTRKWTCKDGSKIRIKDMKDSHLVNTIRFLQRQHQHEIACAYQVGNFFQGEQAQYDIDNQIRSMEDNESEHPLYDDLMEEALKRKLEIE